MFRNAMVMTVGAVFLLFVVAGCGSDPQPKVTNPNAPPSRRPIRSRPFPTRSGRSSFNLNFTSPRVLIPVGFLF